jgi:hypothetical protein
MYPRARQEALLLARLAAVARVATPLTGLASPPARPGSERLLRLLTRHYKPELLTS